jgi:hypothetical protein
MFPLEMKYRTTTTTKTTTTHKQTNKNNCNNRNHKEVPKRKKNTILQYLVRL